MASFSRAAPRRAVHVVRALGAALCFLSLPVGAASAQTDSAQADSAQADSARLATIRYGTETEIAALIESLQNEQSDSLDDELIVLVQTTRNRSILQKVFSFFGGRDKPGLEERAVRAIEERDLETNETVIAAINYLGRLKVKDAVEPLRKLIDTRERRFMVSAIQALGKVSAAER